MKQKFYFLCGNFEKRNFIYATKFGQYEWHYFEEADTLSSAHGSLPQVLDALIGTLKAVKCIEVPLDELQSTKYYDDGKFIFNNKELKTRKRVGVQSLFSRKCFLVFREIFSVFLKFLRFS